MSIDSISINDTVFSNGELEKVQQLESTDVEAMIPGPIKAQSKKSRLRRMNAEIAHQSNLKEIHKLEKERKKQNEEFLELYHKYANWKETPGLKVLIRGHPQVFPDAPVLVKAVANNDYHATEVFLKNGADPQIKGWQVQSKSTPITLAITDNNEKMIELLIRYLPDGCHPDDDLFISNALQMCSLPTLKLLFDKGGGVKRYLQLTIQRHNEHEIRLYEEKIKERQRHQPHLNKNQCEQFVRAFKPYQEFETPYGKCSLKTIDYLNRTLLNAVCCIKDQLPNDILGNLNAQKKFSNEVIEYLLDEGWLPGDSQTFTKLLERNASLSIFQKLLENGCNLYGFWSGAACNSQRNRIDVLRLIVEQRPSFLEDLNHQIQIGAFLSERHDFENYKHFFDKGMKLHSHHLLSAIKNIDKLASDKKSYLLFIQNLLDLGMDPNCLPAAKSTGCNELVELLLEYGARPL